MRSGAPVEPSEADVAFSLVTAGGSSSLGSTFLATNPFVYSSLGYDPIADLAPVTMVGAFPNLMVVPNSSPANPRRRFTDSLRRPPCTGISPFRIAADRLLAGVRPAQPPHRQIPVRSRTRGNCPCTPAANLSLPAAE